MINTRSIHTTIVFISHYALSHLHLAAAASRGNKLIVKISTRKSTVERGACKQTRTAYYTPKYGVYYLYDHSLILAIKIEFFQTKT